MRCDSKSLPISGRCRARRRAATSPLQSPICCARPSLRSTCNPGEVLDKGAICERLGVSRFPVSEALARLQAEGLVDILPQRGSTVSLVRIADVLEYMLIRKALESEAVRVLIGTPADGVIDELCSATWPTSARAAERDDRDAFHEHRLEFHDIISAPCASTKIKGIIEQRPRQSRPRPPADPRRRAA